MLLEWPRFLSLFNRLQVIECEELWPSFSYRFSDQSLWLLIQTQKGKENWLPFPSLGSIPRQLKRYFFGFFLLRLHLEPHHLRKHFFKVFHFLELKKIFLLKKKSFFFSWGGKFFPFGKYHQKSRIITVWVCVFCTTQYCKHRIKFFSLKWGWGEKYENHFLITWQSTYSCFFISVIRHIPSFEQFDTS